MLHNRATIYSNGIADFQRVFKIEGNQPNQISIPVRQQHLGDVLASLTISGDVKILSPPSYQPANQDDGNITISAHNTLIGLANQLIGSTVEVTSGGAVVAGKLVGIDDQQIATSGQPVSEKSLVVLKDTGLSRISIRQIENLKFVDEAIQAEINKALSRRLRDIKPNSTFVDLELGTDESSADAIIQYTIPAAAWKISYRILLGGDGPILFHGHAIVDNNTDEDWKEFVISVVMGQPISFTTDLADSKTPRRSHVNIVQESAFGAVEVEDSLQEFGSEELAGGMGHPTFEASSYEQPNRIVLRKTSSAPKRAAKLAQAEEAEIAETGDFCIFESASPVSIDAHRSAVIPVFATTLDQSKPVLHYKLENHAERPFRALRFKNTTEHSLGRGVCTVYDETTYAGSCILPATKPDGDALLPHALETSVGVNVDQAGAKSRRVGIRISEGVAYESRHELRKTEYLIHSSRDDQFDFLLDHTSRLPESKVVVSLHRQNAGPETVEPERFKHGKRINFRLREKETVKVEVVETRVNESRVALVGNSVDDNVNNTAWLYTNIVESNIELSSDPAVVNCIQLRQRMDDKGLEMGRANNEIERLTKRQTRLRENIKAGNHDQQTSKWQSDLAKAEDSIVDLEENQLPKIRTEQDTLRRQLFDAVKSLAIEWKE